MTVAPAAQEGKEHGGLKASSELGKETPSRRKYSGLSNSAFATQYLPKSISPPLLPFLLAKRDQSLPSGKYTAKI